MHKQYTSSEANNPNFWSEHWSKQDINLQMQAAKKSELIFLFKKYLPQKGKILEAGCGQGIYVNALKELGYEIEGIDFDKTTVEQVNKNFSNLNIKVGDVFNLKYPNNYFSGYISLGVIEHYENNWKMPIIEARRVLNPRGILFLAVPYLNYSRRLVNFFKVFFRKRPGKFYQYLFKPKEIRQAVELEGFEWIATDYYGKSKALMGLPLFGKMFRNQYHKLKLTINNTEIDLKNGSKPKTSIKQFIFKMLPNKWFAHMIVIIASKK